MKILFFVVCLLLARFSTANTLGEIKDGNDAMIEKIIEGFHLLKSSKCQSDLNRTINAFHSRESWAVAMFDASVKSPVGVEYGDEYQFGNFDQCLEVTENLDSIVQSKYCLVDVTLEGYQIRNAAMRHYEIKNSTVVHWAICLPASCSNEDVLSIMKLVTGQKEISIDSKRCQVKESSRFSSLELFFGFALLSFASIVIFSTIYHVYVICTTKNGKLRNDVLLEEIVKSFSMIANIKKLSKESKDELGLSCVNGIKAVSMFFIISGHALVFMVGGPVQNSKFYLEQSQMVQNAFLINSPLLVDSFLLLSGFLFTRLVLIELDKRRGKINFGILYIFRYIRLTPAYLAMIGLYATWFIRLGDGPLWKQRISMEQERCQASWWKNVLYVNNYIGTDQLCMFQSWYLAADTQLFILAPLLIYPLWKHKRVGLQLLTVLTAISIVVPFYVTYTQNLDPTFIAWPSEVSDLSANDYFVNTYGKTHMRSTAYIFGVLAGFIAFHIHKKQFSISKTVRRVLWIFTLIVGLYSMYSVTLYYIPTYEYTQLESALYNSLHRLGWSALASWMLLACVTSENSWLKNFLAWRGLVPISRLTYCAYLTNGFVELYMAASVRTPKYMSVTNLLGETLSHVSLTFLAALILCLIFESPIHGIEKMLLRRHSANAKTCDKASESDEFNVSSRSASTSEMSA